MLGAAFADSVAVIETGIPKPKRVSVVLGVSRDAPPDSQNVIVPVSAASDGGITFSDYLQRTRERQVARILSLFSIIRFSPPLL